MTTKRDPIISHGNNPNQVYPCYCGQWWPTATELASHIDDESRPASKKR